MQNLTTGPGNMYHLFCKLLIIVWIIESLGFYWPVNTHCWILGNFVNFPIDLYDKYRIWKTVQCGLIWLDTYHDILGLCFLVSYRYIMGLFINMLILNFNGERQSLKITVIGLGLSKTKSLACSQPFLKNISPMKNKNYNNSIRAWLVVLYNTSALTLSEGLVNRVSSLTQQSIELCLPFRPFCPKAHLLTKFHRDRAVNTWDIRRPTFALYYINTGSSTRCTTSLSVKLKNWLWYWDIAILLNGMQ